MNEFQLVLEKPQELSLVLDGSNELSLIMDGAVGSYVPPYEGEYQIKPMLTDQNFETQGYKMMENLTVERIPVIQTSNPYGGQTVVIG